MNHRSTLMYIKRVEQGSSAIQESETIDDETFAKENLIFGLRRLEGVNLNRFKQVTGFELDKMFGEKISRLVDGGFLEWKNQNIKFTKKGIMVSDSVITELI